MNTNTNGHVDLPELKDAFNHAQNIFILRQAADAERQEQQLAAKRKRIQDSWEAPLKSLRASLPDWIHQYICEPHEEYECYHNSTYQYRYSSIGIIVPGCNVIAAWVGRYTVAFEVFHPELVQDEDGSWYVTQALWKFSRPQEDLDYGETDIAVALFRAHEAELQTLELQATAAERNSRPEPEVLLVPAPEPAAEPADPIDQALELVEMLTQNKQIKRDPHEDAWEEDNEDDRTLVLAGVGIAIAYHLRRVADALEPRQWS